MTNKYQLMYVCICHSIYHLITNKCFERKHSNQDFLLLIIENTYSYSFPTELFHFLRYTNYFIQVPAIKYLQPKTKHNIFRKHFTLYKYICFCI